jgi:hypothetical protein
MLRRNIIGRHFRLQLQSVASPIICIVLGNVQHWMWRKATGLGGAHKGNPGGKLK